MQGVAESSNFERVAEPEMAGMTHGRSAKTRSNPRTKRSATLLTRFSRGVKKRLFVELASLAGRVATLEKKVNRLDGVAPGYYSTGIDATRRKPGPGKNIENWKLLNNRDGLVGWLEEVWPEIVKPLLSVKDPRKLATILRKVARPKDIQPPWQSRCLAHPAKLLDFLHSDKFTRKPPKKTVIDALNNRRGDDDKRKRAANRLPTRQIANAMAGLPEIEWRTSLDRCSENPCYYPVALGTGRHYRAMFGIPAPKAKKPKR